MYRVSNMYLYWPGVGLAAAALIVLLVTTFAGRASTSTAARPWAYRLVHDSGLVDDCPICVGPISLELMRGSFQLRLLERNPLFARYAIENIDFSAGLARSYRITGNGTFQIGGEVALAQEMSLELLIDDGVTNSVGYFTNKSAALERTWPMIDIALVQTNGTDTRQYSLRLAAAPVRELWFSTVSSFNASSGVLGTVDGGDLISSAGHVVKRSADLFASVGAFPTDPDLGLDAVDILPGGEIAFSLGSSIISTTLGPLQHGDWLSNRGRILRRNQELLAPFGVLPAEPDLGLSAVHTTDDGEVLFSIAADVYSERLGGNLQRGDLLSSSGLVVRRNQQLLARFHPPKPATADYGLDAVYFWPGGEIWFSTELGFQDEVLGPILDGDLLSDQGYIVYRNRELVEAFAPADVAAGLGLDALYLVTDVMPPAPAPRLAISADPSVASVSLSWEGAGRVFQIERAGTVADSFEPVTSLFPGSVFVDAGALTNRAPVFYRLLQW